MMHQKNRNPKSLLLLISLAGLSLSACSSIPNPLSLFDGEDKKAINTSAEEQAKRISVLESDEALVPDLKYANAEIQLPPPYVNAAWTQPGGDADHTMHHLSAADSVKKIWTVKAGTASKKHSPLTAPPVVADGRVYTIDNEAQISAFDANSGKRVWRTKLTPNVKEKRKFWKSFAPGNKASEIGFGGGVAYDNGRLFFASGFGFVGALNPETGELIWQSDTPAPVRSAPTAQDGKVFVVTNTNEFLAFNQADGSEAWNYQSFEEAARFLTATSPAVDGEVVIAPFSSGQVAALRIDNGRELWTDTIGRASRLNALSDLSDIAASPVIDRGLIFVASHAGEMRAIDLRSGEAVWDISLGTLQTPWISGDYIFVVTVDNQLVCLNRADGAVIWNSQLPRYEKEKKKKNRISWAGPVIAGGNLLLVSTNGKMISVSPQNGEVRHSVKAGDGAMSLPVVANETVYILDVEGKLSAFR